MWDFGKMLHASIYLSVHFRWCRFKYLNILIRDALRDIFYQSDDNVYFSREVVFPLKSNSLTEIMQFV